MCRWVVWNHWPVTGHGKWHGKWNMKVYIPSLENDMGNDMGKWNMKVYIPTLEKWKGSVLWNVYGVNNIIRTVYSVRHFVVLEHLSSLKVKLQRVVCYGVGLLASALKSRLVPSGHIHIILLCMKYTMALQVSNCGRSPDEYVIPLRSFSQFVYSLNQCCFFNMSSLF